MTFIGQIYNNEPGSGVNSYDGLTLKFGDTLVGDALIGAKTSSLGEYSNEALTWYKDQFGLEGNVMLTWHPGMHGAGDSELVLNTPASMGNGFMSPIAKTPELLAHTASDIVQKSNSWTCADAPETS